MNLRQDRIVLVMSLKSPWSIDIACQFSALGQKVVVLTDETYDLETAAGTQESVQRLHQANVRIIQPTAWLCHLPRSLRLLVLVVKLRLSLRFSHVLCLYGGLYSFIAFLSGVRPYSVYWVGSDILLGSYLKGRISGLIASRATRNFINGQHLTKQAAIKFPDAKLRPLYLGIDTVFWNGEGVHFTHQIICTRWFEAIYDNKTILDACIPLLISGVDLRLVFTSTGTQLEKLKTYTLASLPSELHNRVRFLGGVTRLEMRDFLGSSSIYISMSRSDGTSTALLEALASGLYPILSDIPANQEWIEVHHCEGALVRPGDPEMLAEKIRSALAIVSSPNWDVHLNKEIVNKYADSKENLRKLLCELTTPTNL